MVTIGVKSPSGIHDYAVVGGTGAYENAGGHAKQVEGANKSTFTLFLVP